MPVIVLAAGPNIYNSNPEMCYILTGGIEFGGRGEVEGGVKVLTVVGILQNAYPLLFFLSLPYINSF